MFSGIIEEIGIIQKITKNVSGAMFCVGASFCSEIKIGDSVAINGVCSTVVEKTSIDFCVEFSNHTLNLTNLSALCASSKVNLERALSFNGRLDGHIVSGHVDGTTQISSIVDDGFSKKISFNLQSLNKRQIVKKGSITIDGISLTVSNLSEENFSVTVIPHTLQNTTLLDKKVGDVVNYETDILGKYVERIMLYPNENSQKISKIDETFLIEKGFF